MYCKFFKPLFDVSVAFIALVILSPILIIVALAIKLDSPGPVFFLQERLGRNGRVFRIFKFRSMVNRKDNFVKGVALKENDPKITKVGRFIRKTSLDELPQLINIVKGDMSFIGPRPPMVHYPKVYSEYNEFELQRFSVKPGISGLAAVKAREVHDWSLNIPMDVEYVQNQSASMDFRLFTASLLMFFKTSNIYSK
jgi:lipopolysaccharide/colanic/teichoic acid biosynthesis glycosyltransferase